MDEQGICQPVQLDVGILYHKLCLHLVAHINSFSFQIRVTEHISVLHYFLYTKYEVFVKHIIIHKKLDQGLSEKNHTTLANLNPVPKALCLDASSSLLFLDSTPIISRSRADS